jgi:hypothetical protein
MEGRLLPSALIFHCATVPAELLAACADWACIAKPKSHMMDGPSWRLWLDRFAVQSGASRQDPVLLKLDNHGSREVGDNVVYAKSLGVEIFALDSHSTSARCEVDTALAAPLKREVRRLKQRKAARCPGVARMGLPEEVRLLRAACESEAAAPHKLAKAWLDTGFSDGTELGVNMERALAWCLPVVRPPAALAEGVLSAAAAAELAHRATLLAHERGAPPAPAPPPAAKRRKCTAARFLTGDAHLAALRETEEAEKQAAQAAAAAKAAKKEGAAAEKARRAAEKQEAATSRLAAAAERRAQKEEAQAALRTNRAKKVGEKGAMLTPRSRSGRRPKTARKP